MEADGSPDLFAELVDMARAYRRARALSVAAELGVADHLGDEPVPVTALAVATASDADSLYRLLRALAALGVFAEDEDRSFRLTPTGELLRSDHPRSVRPIARLLGADYEWAAWGRMLHGVRTGENAATDALGMDVWEHRRRNAHDHEVFDAAMRTFSSNDAPALLRAHDFARYSVVADVGGGTGALLAEVLRATPGVRGILFDQPQVVAAATPVLERAGVADRVDVRGGSFFDSVPRGADVYLLRRILHDWSDQDALRILRAVRHAASVDSRLVVIDAVLGPPNEDPGAKFLDLGMMVSEGGRERDAGEWESLLAAGGFRIASITRATRTSHVIEADVDSSPVA
jgi:O-methyltransferase/methyltransferase family protein